MKFHYDKYHLIFTLLVLQNAFDTSYSCSCVTLVKSPTLSELRIFNGGGRSKHLCGPGSTTLLSWLFYIIHSGAEHVSKNGLSCWAHFQLLISKAQ